MVPGVINDGVATCAITVDALRLIRRASPGLRTMHDRPVPGFYVGDGG